MKDGEKNPVCLESQEWQYFCTGSLGEGVGLYISERLLSEPSKVLVFCKAWSNRCWNQGVVAGISVPFGWCCRCPMKSDFQEGCFVSQIQHWVGEVSQRKMGLTCSHMLQAENLLSSLSAPSLICHWNGLRWQGRRLQAEGFLGTGSACPLSQRLLWTVEGWTPEWLHKGFQALVHDTLKIF